jgi:hypothetical protein
LLVFRYWMMESFFSSKEYLILWACFLVFSDGSEIVLARKNLLNTSFLKFNSEHAEKRGLVG